MKVKNLKPSQVHKMVACKKPLAMFPKTAKKDENSSIKTSQKTKFNLEKNALKEELLDDLDELTEDQLNLFKDTELLHTIALSDNLNNIKFHSENIKEEHEIVDGYNFTKSHNNKDKK